MKKLTLKNLKKMASQLWQDESAQGTAEYILLLVAIIAIALIFKDQIKQLVTNKMDEIKSSVSDFK